MATTTSSLPQDQDPSCSDSNIIPTKDLNSLQNDSNVSEDLSFLLNFLSDDKNRHSCQQIQRNKGNRKLTIIPDIQAYKSEFLQYMQSYKDESSFLISEVSDLGDGRLRFEQLSPNDLDSRLPTMDHTPNTLYKKSFTMPLGALSKDESIEKHKKSKSKTWIIYSMNNIKPGEIVKPSGFAKFKKTEVPEVEIEQSIIEGKRKPKLFSAADLSIMKSKRHKQELIEFLDFVEKNKKMYDSNDNTSKETKIFTKFKISELREYIKTKE